MQPLLDGKLRSAFSMTEPERRRRPDAAHDAGGPRRRRVGDQRPQVVHVERLGRRLPHRDGRHQPRRAPVPGQLDDHRAHRHARASTSCATSPTMEHPDDGTGAVRRSLGDHLPRRARAVREPRRQRGRRLRARPEAPRPGSHPPLHALAGPERSGPSTCCASGRCRATRTARYLAEKQTIQNWVADSTAEMQAARLMTLHAAWKMDQVGARRRPASRSP